MVSKQSSDLLLLEDVQWYSFLGILETNVSAWSCFSYPGPSLTRWLQVLLMLYWPQICSGELACLLTPGQAARQIYTYILIIALESFLGELTGQKSSTNPSLWDRVSFWRLKHSQQCYQANSVLPRLFSFFLIPLFLVLPLLPFLKQSDTQGTSSAYPCALWGFVSFQG